VLVLSQLPRMLINLPGVIMEVSKCFCVSRALLLCQRPKEFFCFLPSAVIFIICWLICLHTAQNLLLFPHRNNVHGKKGTYLKRLKMFDNRKQKM